SPERAQGGRTPRVLPGGARGSSFPRVPILIPEEVRMSGIESTVPRRRFLKPMGLAGIGPTLVPQALALAQTSAPAAPAATPAAPDTAKAAAPPEISEDAKALGAMIQRRYGKYLTPEQIQ